MSYNVHIRVDVKVNKNGKSAGKKSATPIPLDDAFAHALAHVRRMTLAQRRKSLKDAGIITANGKLAPCYQ